MSAGDWAIVALSLRVAIVATFCSLPLAIWVARILSRSSHSGQGKAGKLGITALNLLVHIPLVLPPVVTGYVLLLLFGKTGPLGQVFDTVFGLTFAFRWTGAALAAAVMGFPLMVRAIRLAFEAIPEGLEEAAATLGAPRRDVFLHVSLPLALPGIIAGAVLGFAKALGEFGATITFVAAIPGETETLPSAIYTALQVPGGEADAFRLVVVSLVLAVGALALSEWLARRATLHVQGEGAP